MAQPLVSCIIPTYNRAKFVRDAIDSALVQDYSAIEVIVVDDGSTDNTPDVLASYGEKIKSIRQNNAGTAAARNTGVAASSGELISWLDSDDLWLPAKISRQVAVLETHPDAGVVYCRAEMQSDEYRLSDLRSNVAQGSSELKPKGELLATLIAESNILTPCVMLKRSVFDEVGGFDPNMYAEDWDLHFRIAQKCRFARMEDVLTIVRIHETRKTTDRYPHAMGLLELRKRIESARQPLIADDPTGEIAKAYKIHDRKFAETYYQVGKQLGLRGQRSEALKMLAEARRRDPAKLKYYTRALQSLFMKTHNLLYGGE